ncbi:Uncharacterised protein [Cedecea neteri]|uniref:Uncharacterized protein n=1 Tax=Cedecea neteri TaxID=158822 RepID=A0A2X3L1H3_9ENTR|nr:Uncharacterised protein [Cedecea neteri]
MVAFGYDVTDAREREVRGKNQLAIGGPASPAALCGWLFLPGGRYHRQLPIRASSATQSSCAPSHQYLTDAACRRQSGSQRAPGVCPGSGTEVIPGKHLVARLKGFHLRLDSFRQRLHLGQRLQPGPVRGRDLHRGLGECRFAVCGEQPTNMVAVKRG